MVACHRWLGFASTLLDPATIDSLATFDLASNADLTYTSNVTVDDTDTSPWSAAINGTPATVNSVAQNGADGVQLMLGTQPTSGDTVQVTYAPPPYTISTDSNGAHTPPQTISGTTT